MSFQGPSASSPCVPALLALTLSCPVTRGTCTACRTTSATATAGPCFVPGEALDSPLLLVSFAPWLPLSSQYPDPPAPNPGKKTAPSAKAGNNKKTSGSQQWTSNGKSSVPCAHLSNPLHSVLVPFGFYVFTLGVSMTCYLTNTRSKSRTKEILLKTSV